MKLYNTLTRKIEEFKPRNPQKVGMYTCGPTVYDYVTIGNWRTYVLGDLLVRALKYLGFKVDYVMNITDVGHLTGDNLGDASMGEDRQEKAAKKEGKSAWDLAKLYSKDFIEGYKKLNLTRPKVWCRATEHIKEQTELIQLIEKKGFTYKIDDGIYFDTIEYESKGNKYGELSTLDQIKEGARIEPAKGKKDPRDFALWKFSPKNEQRQMEWDSPWGKGFPGWHIECSAMSMKYLGEQFDIHLGGEDLRSTHHPNEIAQSEAATGKKPFVKYWVHGAFLLVEGGRMGKSLGNAYTLHDVEKKGFGPLALRYFYLTGHYRKQLNFTWEGLEAAQQALTKLKSQNAKLKTTTKNLKLSSEVQTYQKKFKEALENDLSVPQALAVMWDAIKSKELTDDDKWRLLVDFDQVLGLGLKAVEKVAVSAGVAELVRQREELRKRQEFAKADELRRKIEAKGYRLEDTDSGPKLWRGRDLR